MGVFRPVSVAGEHDRVVELLLSHPGVEQEYADALAVTYDDLHADAAAAHAEIVNRFGDLSHRFDALVVLGSDYADLATQSELAFNARIAANLGSPVVLVVPGVGRTPAQIRSAADLARAELAAEYAQPLAVFANRVAPENLDATRAALAEGEDLLTGALPEVPLLIAPSVQDLMTACNGHLVLGSPEWLSKESLGFVVAAMSLENVLVRLHEDTTVIAPGDRPDLLPGLLLAHQSGTFPRLAAIVLTGGYEPPAPIDRLLRRHPAGRPDHRHRPGHLRDAPRLWPPCAGTCTAGSTVKVETALRVFAECDRRPARPGRHGRRAVPGHHAADVPVPADRVGRRTIAGASSCPRVTTNGSSGRRPPCCGSASPTSPCSARRRRCGPRPPSSASTCRRPRCRPNDPDLVERFAVEYTRLRAAKGMTVERARRHRLRRLVLRHHDGPSRAGRRDGRPVRRTRPRTPSARRSRSSRRCQGYPIVSSVFLMCLADRVLVYADCAVNPDPTAEQLADIAISSADTALRFGIEPRIAMLSYSTGTSGSGSDVDKVRAATELVHGNGVPICWSRVRSSTTPRSTLGWPQPNCRGRRWPGGRRC